MNVSRVIGAGLSNAWALRVSTSTAAEPHAQHGTTLLVGLETDLTAGGVCARAVLIAPDVVHSLHSPGPSAGFLFDPELLPRTAAAARERGVRALEGAELHAVLDAARAQRARISEAETLRGLAQEVGTRIGLHARAPSLDRRVAHVLEGVRAGRPRHEVVAGTGVSAGHLQELFVRDVGIPLRTWRLWRKLIAAIGAYARMDATDAAHEAGFADAAHFSRTCRRMLGYSPTELRGGFQPKPLR